jgi:hypothetical protein
MVASGGARQFVQIVGLERSVLGDQLRRPTRRLQGPISTTFSTWRPAVE